MMEEKDGSKREVVKRERKMKERRKDKVMMEKVD